MSNKDIKNLNYVHECNNIDFKDDISIFNLSSLKSKEIIVSNLNNFNFDLSKEKSKLNFINVGQSSNIFDNKIISEKETNHINNYFLKSYHHELPSSENKWKKYFNMNEYDSSFANFCGINKEKFNDIFINNQHKSILNEFGDINLSQKIINLLKTDPSLTRKNDKKYFVKKRYKIVFKTQKNAHPKKIKK